MKRLIPALSLIPSLLLSLPQGAEVVSGNASISQPNPHSLVIQVEDKTIVNFKSFNIAEHETAHFVQPKTTSTVLARVKGSDPSKILGQLKANGKLFLVNPNGIFFGPRCEVNVGSLIASTLDIEDADFKEGKYRFQVKNGAKNSQILNQGLITASPEGHVVLLAPHIVNKGVIVAQAGRIGLVAGEIVTVDFSGDGLISFIVEGKLETAIIEHLGKISAQQGQVLLHLKAADQLIKSVVNLEGFVKGETIVKENGVIRIAAGSQIEAAHVDIAGHKVEVLGDVTPKVGSLSIKGKTIATAAPIDCARVTLEGEALYIGSNIKTRNHAIEFNGPVIFTQKEITLSTGTIGDRIHFAGPVDAAPHVDRVNLTLAAGSGDIIFDNGIGGTAPLGLITIVNAGNVTINSMQAGSLIQSAGTGATTLEGPINLTGELYLNCHVVNINDDVMVQGSEGVTINNFGSLKIAPRTRFKVNGPFLQKGKGDSIIGARLAAEGNVTFTGPVLLIDNVNIRAGGGSRDVVFHSTVDGPGGLSIDCSMLHFSAGIGTSMSLAALKADKCSLITLGNIGGVKPGVTGPVDLGAGVIDFHGTTIHANGQKYKATEEFLMTAQKPTTFLSSYSNAPIVFEQGEIKLSQNTDLSITTTNGNIYLGRIKGNHLQNILCNADQGSVVVGTIGKGEEIGHLSIRGGIISLSDSIIAEQISLDPAEILNIYGDITALKGDLLFLGPVMLEAPKLQFSSKEKGGIIFRSSIDGNTELGLVAPEGCVRFDGPVGIKSVKIKDEKKPLSLTSLTITSRIIDQNDAVKTTGPVIYTGEIFLGGKINTANNAVVFDGPVVRDNIDTVSVNTGSKLGDIIFNAPLDADQPSRSLYLDAGSGNIHFKDSIGKKGALGEFSTHSKEVFFKDIGGNHPGVALHLHVKAKESIHFNGTVYNAQNQYWDAKKEFYLLAPEKTRFISHGKPIDFYTGTVRLNKGPLDIVTNGGEFTIAFLSGEKGDDVAINSGSGRLSLGAVTGKVGHLRITGDEIVLRDEIHAYHVQMQGGALIRNSEGEAYPIVSLTDITLNSTLGSVGSSDSPIKVEALNGKIYVGAKTWVNLEGIAADNVLTPLSSNRPAEMYFNGLMQYDFFYDDQANAKEEFIHPTADLFNSGGDFIDVNVVKPRRASLYYQHR